MKLLACLFLSLLFLGCKPQPEEVMEGREPTRRFQSQPVTIADLQRINLICNALQRKYDMLHILYGSTYTFDYSEKSCTDSQLGPVSALQASIDLDRSDYVFRSTSRPFPFPIIETPVSGIMRELCGVRNLTNPQRVSSGGAIWFSTEADARYCRPDSDHLCIMIERGSHRGGDDFAIHTREWMRIRTRDGRRGFVTERFVRSRGDCPVGQTIEKRLLLR
jgi:hypothetical protein